MLNITPMITRKVALRYTQKEMKKEFEHFTRKMSAEDK